MTRILILALLFLNGCDNQPGDFDPFEVTIIVHGAGTGSGSVGEVEEELDISCQIVAGEPSEPPEATTGNRCRDSFQALNGFGSFQLIAAPAAGHEFVGWTGDCEIVQGTVCQMGFVSITAVTLTAVAEFRPVGLIIAPSSATFRPHGAVAKW